jgi:hypothetical protein
MDQRLKPAFFYGSGIAALTGLLFGFVLHAAWQKRPGGPQIIFASAAAAEFASPNTDAPTADQTGPEPADPVQLADLDTGPVTPDPLPVTRLAPDMFDVQPAAASEGERQDVGDVVADDAPQPSARDLD